MRTVTDLNQKQQTLNLDSHDPNLVKPKEYQTVEVLPKSEIELSLDKAFTITVWSLLISGTVLATTASYSLNLPTQPFKRVFAWSFPQLVVICLLQNIHGFYLYQKK